jgi:hypothetical protein
MPDSHEQDGEMLRRVAVRASCNSVQRSCHGDRNLAWRKRLKAHSRPFAISRRRIRRRTKREASCFASKTRERK